MKLGYIGLGKMGFGMVEQLLEKGHEIVATNRGKEAVDQIKEKGAEGVYTNKELVDSLSGPRVIWVMVPWQAVDEVLSELCIYLSPGDLIIDGGNSPYLETVRRAKELTEKGFRFMDVGVSGGPSGARNGACMMIGGEREDFEQLEPLFKDINVTGGYGYMGNHGAGHFVKMVHNGIEYGMMQAIAEGFEVMRDVKEFDVDLLEVTKVYNHGSVIESRLIGWLQSGYEKYGVDLKDISGEVSHLGEGKWTIDVAKSLNIPTPIIEGALKFREDSQGNPSYTGQVVSVLRNQFGGHIVSKGADQIKYNEKK